MNKDEIVLLLNKIFSKYFNLSEEFKEENFDKFLTSYFSFDYTHLVYLYILIEKTFNITINCKGPEIYQFNTINGIINVIMESM